MTTDSTRYEIRTIADIFEKIPTECLERFFQELEVAIVTKRCLEAVGSVINKEPVEFKFSERPFVWVDDDKRQVSVCMNGEPYVTVTLVPNE